MKQPCGPTAHKAVGNLSGVSETYSHQSHSPIIEASNNIEVANEAKTKLLQRIVQLEGEIFVTMPILRREKQAQDS